MKAFMLPNVEEMNIVFNPIESILIQVAWNDSDIKHFHLNGI
jgi:hypothetical protein